MATAYERVETVLQAGVSRKLTYVSTTAEVPGTVTVSKNGGAFGVSTTTGATIEDKLQVLTVAAADLDTEGDLCFKCVGATDTVYVLCGQVKLDTIEAADLGADCITAAAIADDAIVAANLATGCLTADAFAADAIIAATLATGVLTADAFAADALIAATFATGAFTADVFAADALVAATFATDCITDDAIATGAIAATAFAAGAIDAAAIATNAIDDDAIATGAIASTAFAAGAITAASIAADAIGASELAADAATEIAGGITTVAAGMNFLGEVKTNEATAAERSFTVQVFADETQTISVSKNGGAYAAATGATCAKIATANENNVYKLVLAKANVDTRGDLVVELKGTTGTKYYRLAVTDYDPIKVESGSGQAAAGNVYSRGIR